MREIIGFFSVLNKSQDLSSVTLSKMLCQNKTHEKHLGCIALTTVGIQL